MTGVQDHNGDLVNNVVERDLEGDLAKVIKYLKSVPPGYRFMPDDVELVLCYLQPKINGGVLPPNLVHNVNIYNYHPDYLTRHYRPQDDKVWYFFTPRDRKYPMGNRPRRQADGGFWKASGKERKIIYKGRVIGCRRALVFYEGQPPRGMKTSWIMHEIWDEGHTRKVESRTSNDTTSETLDNHVLCKVYNIKDRNGRRHAREDRQEGEASEEDTPGDSEEQVPVVDHHRSDDQQNIKEHDFNPNAMASPLNWSNASPQMLTTNQPNQVPGLFPLQDNFMPPNTMTSFNGFFLPPPLNPLTSRYDYVLVDSMASEVFIDLPMVPLDPLTTSYEYGLTDPMASDDFIALPMAPLDLPQVEPEQIPTEMVLPSLDRVPYNYTLVEEEIIRRSSDRRPSFYTPSCFDELSEVRFSSRYNNR